MAKKFTDLLAKLPAERLERIQEQTEALSREMVLAELRKARNITQAQLAQKLGIKQPSVADMEKRADMYVSTLRSLIEAMGGELEVIAKFPGARVRIRNFSEI